MNKANVTNDEVNKCYITADAILFEMQDIARRIDRGHVDRIEDCVTAAKMFGIIARAASELTVKLLTVAKIQRLKDETNALRAKLDK